MSGFNQKSFCVVYLKVYILTLAGHYSFFHFCSISQECLEPLTSLRRFTWDEATATLKKMEEDLAFTCRFKDVISNILGVVLFVIDLALDLLAVVTFYKEEAYVAMGVLIFFLLGSSLLVHTLSWLWYDYEFEDEQEGREYVYLEKYLTNRKLFGVLHLCQLAIFSRLVAV